MTLNSNECARRTSMPFVRWIVKRDSKTKQRCHYSRPLAVCLRVCACVLAEIAFFLITLTLITGLLPFLWQLYIPQAVPRWRMSRTADREHTHKHTRRDPVHLQLSSFEIHSQLWSFPEPQSHWKYTTAIYNLYMVMNYIIDPYSHIIH